MEKISNWFYQRTPRELNLLYLLALVIMFVGVGQYLESVWGYFWLAIGLALYQTTTITEVNAKAFGLAQQQVNKMAVDVDNQLDEIFQHIRGEK